MEDKFIPLTHSMIRRKDMTMQEKIIYLEILNLSSLDKGCIASNNHFEKCFGMPKKSVSNTISSLIKKGFIESELKDRNHTRILSIKNGQESIKDGQLSIKSGETKENKTINKTKNNYDAFIDYLKSKCKYKSKVSKTKDGEKLFKQIEDKKELAKDYIKHQEEEGNYAKRITAFMEDYETVYKPTANKDWSDGYSNTSEWSSY